MRVRVMRASVGGRKLLCRDGPEEKSKTHIRHEDCWSDKGPVSKLWVKLTKMKKSLQLQTAMNNHHRQNLLKAIDVHALSEPHQLTNHVHM